MTVNRHEFETAHRRQTRIPDTVEKVPARQELQFAPEIDPADIFQIKNYGEKSNQL
jgi:hypothetical protein